MIKYPGIRRTRKIALPHEYRFVGIDEAGRGPVLGPLVIAICSLTKRDLAWCVKHNVTDSKKIPPMRRNQLAEALKRRCWYSVAIIDPPEIDQAVYNKNFTLNGLEANYMSRLITEFKQVHAQSPAQIMVDSPVKNSYKFRTLLDDLSGWDNIETLLAQNHADENYRHVGAASIIAKATRDQIIKNLEQKSCAPLGSGYPSDSIARDYVKQASKDDPLIRWSWMTAKTIHQLHIQDNQTLV